MSESKTTTEHDEIKRWVEERGGRPVSVRGTGDGDPGVLRIDFEGVGAGEESFEPLGWDEFFAKFDREGLAFLYQDETSTGDVSRFFKFVNR